MTVQRTMRKQSVHNGRHVAKKDIHRTLGHTEEEEEFVRRPTESDTPTRLPTGPILTHSPFAKLVEHGLPQS